MAKLMQKVKVRAGSGEIVARGEDLVVSTTEPRQYNRANRDVIKQLAKYYGVPAGNIRIVKGSRSREKIFEISD